MARRLGPSHMRVAGAVGGVVACVGAGVAVASSPKPAGAPLNPPVDTSLAVDRSTPSPSATAAPACGVDPQVEAALQQLRAAKTRAERQLILRGLAADQRQQVTALAAGADPCGSAGSAAAEPMPTIEPSVVDGGGPAAPPITSTYVS